MAPLGWFGRDFKPLASPDPFDPLVIDDPDRRASKQRRNLPIFLSAILAGKYDDVGGQLFLVVSSRRNKPLGGSVLSEHQADPALGYFQFGSYMLNARAATRRACELSRAASARAILSSGRSDTARKRRGFAASSSLIREPGRFLGPRIPSATGNRCPPPPVVPMARTASAILLPYAAKTSNWRNSLTISSGVGFFLGILPPFCLSKDIFLGGPVQGVRSTLRSPYQSDRLA